MQQRNKEAEVWQRVMAPAGPGELGLGPMIRESRQRLEALGKYPDLQRRERGILSALGGMAKLRGEKEGPPAGTRGKGLPWCYHSACRAAAEFTARWADPEFGGAFQELTGLAQKQCLGILKVLGKS